MEHEEELITRRERLRTQRQAEYSAPARIRLRLGAVAVALVALLSWITVSWISHRSVAEPVSDAVPLEAASPQGEEGESAAEETEALIVHVAGAVRDPRVIQLEPGDRVIDAVEAAGGLTEDAAPDGVNLAAAAQDGTLIFVPTAEELESGDAPPVAEGGPETSSIAGAQQDGVVNLNTADAAELEQLPGIGPALAERIMTYRETNGEFNSLEELAAVSGIGPAILENIVDDVTW